VFEKAIESVDARSSASKTGRGRSGVFGGCEKRTSRTGVPYDALKLMLSCLTKNMSRMPCDPGAGVEARAWSDGVDATRFIGDPPAPDGSRGFDADADESTRTRPVNGAPRLAMCCLRSANDADVVSREIVDAFCGGVAGAGVASRVSRGDSNARCSRFPRKPGSSEDMRPGERGHRPPRRSVRERVDSCALSVRSAKVRNLRTSRAALARVFVVAARRREPSCPFAGTRDLDQ
jgi:hypothetical protein